LEKCWGIYTGKGLAGLVQPNQPNIHQPDILHTYPPVKMEQTERSETSAYTIQTPANYPEESIQHSEQGESLKLRTFLTISQRKFAKTSYTLHQVFICARGNTRPNSGLSLNFMLVGVNDVC
jgi:hypothetical protein